MKIRNLKTKAMSILLTIVMLVGMLPMSAFATETDASSQGGSLTITTKNFGTGAITVKKDGADVTQGTAGETYNVAGFDPNTLVGLYLLTDGETVPETDFEIESDFRAVLGGAGGYDFTMPDEAITIAAIFSDYTPPTTINLFAMIVEGTSGEQLANGNLLYNYEMPTVSGFESGKTLTVDTVGEYITVDDIEHQFVGFYKYSYDDATATETHSVSDTYEIGIEPADKESDEWSAWYTPLSDGVYAVYVSTDHAHSWSAAYNSSETHHWFECDADGCFITGNADKSGYEEHNFNSNFICANCGYQQPFTIIPSMNTVKGNGTVTFFVNRNLVSGQFSCSEEHYNHTDFISGGGNHWTFEMQNNVDLNMTFTASHGGENVSCVVSFVQDPDALILTSSHTSLTGPGTVFFTTNKDVDYIDCSNYTYEEYITGSGKEWKLEKTNNADPTLRFTVKTEDGESAMCWVEFISSSVLIYEDDSTRVVFESDKGTVIPENAELVIDAYKAGVEQIPGSQQKDLTFVALTNDEIEIITDTSKTINGVTYTLYELIEINGTKHQIDSIKHDSLKLLNLDSGDFYEYHSDGSLSRIRTHGMELVVLSEACKININGVEYDIVLKMTGQSKYDRWFLYYNGSPAGVYHSTNDNADFLKGYDPATLSGKQDSGDLGTITVGNPPVADLTAGTTYYVTVVGSNDIHLENAENVSGTLTQTFSVPDALVGRTDVTYVAVHDKNPYAAELAAAKKVMDEAWENEQKYSTRESAYAYGMAYFNAADRYKEVLEKYNDWEKQYSLEHGTVTLSEDGTILTATYTVDSFSPFIVYAFVEADEPEIKQLNATIHAEHTDADGDDKCDVCGEDYSNSTDVPGTVDPSDNPQTGGNSHMALWIALLFISGGAATTLCVYDKKEKTGRNLTQRFSDKSQ